MVPFLFNTVCEHLSVFVVRVEVSPVVWQLSTNHLSLSQALLGTQASLKAIEFHYLLQENTMKNNVSHSSSPPKPCGKLLGGEAIADILMVILGRVAQSCCPPKWISALRSSCWCSVKQSRYKSAFGKRRTINTLSVQKMDEDMQSVIVRVSYLVSQKIIMFLQPIYHTQRTKKETQRALEHQRGNN